MCNPDKGDSQSPVVNYCEVISNLGKLGVRGLWQKETLGVW